MERKNKMMISKEIPAFKMYKTEAQKKQFRKNK